MLVSNFTTYVHVFDDVVRLIQMMCSMDVCRKFVCALQRTSNSCVQGDS